MTLLLLTVAAALSISFLCSILEATLLSAPPSQLIERSERGQRRAALLLELKHERVDDAIGAILTLNTVAHTVGAAVAGAQAAAVFGDRWIGVFSAVLTLLVLVVTEIIPKTLGTVYALRLVGFVAVVTDLLTRVLWLPLAALRLVTQRLGAGGHRPQVSGREVAAMAALAARSGTVREATSRMVANALRLREVTVENVMTPRTVMAMMPADATIDDLAANDRVRPFSRIPLYEVRGDEVVGHVLQRDVLIAAARGAPGATPLSQFLRSLPVIPETASVETALQRLADQDERVHMALVVDEFGSVSGLVTLEDLVETVLGIEIVDEHDRVADLRVEARRLAERRWARAEQAARRTDA